MEAIRDLGKSRAQHVGHQQWYGRWVDFRCGCSLCARKNIQRIDVAIGKPPPTFPNTTQPQGSAFLAFPFRLDPQISEFLRGWKLAPLVNFEFTIKYNKNHRSNVQFDF